MDRVVDLDLAAREIESRRVAWGQAGFTVGPLTWRDAEDSWPQTLQVDRAAVVDPDSVGVALDYGDLPAASIVLFRGGWADVDFIDLSVSEVVALVPDVVSPSAFGVVLDEVMDRVCRSLPQPGVST